MSRSKSNQITNKVKMRVACILGDEKSIEELLKSDPDLLNTHLEYGKTPLSIAAGWGQEEICKFVHLHFETLFLDFFKS